MSDREGEGEGREEETEDLFEDLDKFFAPIQGVDWPEPAGTPAPAEEPVREEVAPEPAEEPVQEPEREPLAEEPIEEERPAAEPSWTAEEEVHEEAAEESAQVEEVQIELEAEGVEEYEPQPVEETVTVVAEELPPEGQVEEAAEHFAESVRAEGSEEVEQDILADIEEPAEEPRRVKVGAEGLLGPSWQEPTSEEVGAEAVTARGGRDVSAALLTGLILAALAVGSLALGRPVFAGVASVIVLLAQGEVYAAMHRRHYQPATALGLVFGALVLAGAYWRGEGAMMAMVALCLVFTAVWEMSTPSRHRRDVLVNIALTTLGVVWIPFLAGFALLMLDAEPMGRVLVLAVLGLTFAYDTAAFAFGSLWGDHPLAPHVSPRKSWEGAVAGTLVVVLASMGLVPQIEGIGVGGAAGLAIIVAIFAPLGDLTESLIKRDLGLKDMGSILPGHGGVIDRIDSVLFVAPAALVFLRMLFIG